MKIIAKIFMFLFIAFLLTPTIVCAIDDSSDTSVFYNLSEEEHAKKEIKTFLYSDFHPEILILSQLTSSLILSENLSKHDTIHSKIFIPPPEQA